MRASKGVVEPLKASSESAAATIGGVHDAARVAQGERAAGGHQVRAVDQREALLGGQLRAAPEARAAQRVGTR